MLVAELTGRREFRLREERPPEPGPGEVQVRIQAVGVCGSDLHSYSEGAVGDTPCEYPMVLGHEPAGVVVKTGPGVTGWAPGDRAAFEPAIFCYHCEFCMAGLHNVCSELRFMSAPGEPGFFRQLANLPARSLLGLPAGVGAREGSLAEPLAVVLHSMKFAAVEPGGTAAIFGAGPIGLLTLAVLKLSGAGRVWIVDPLQHRRGLARAMGADAALDASDPVRQILADTGGRGVDVAIDCASRDNTINQAIQVARSAGRVVVTGIPSGVETAVEFSPMRRKELALFNVRRSNQEAPLAIELLSREARRFAPLITHARPIEEIAGAFAIVERYEDGVGKMVVG